MHPQHTQWVLAVTKQREVPALPILDLKARRELRYADTRSAPLEHNKVLAYRSEAGHQYEVPARHAELRRRERLSQRDGFASADAQRPRSSKKSSCHDVKNRRLVGNCAR